MNSTRLLLWVLLFVSVGALQAQQISGTIVDDEGIGLIGATILVTGTNVGTVTDIDGNFTITVPPPANTLTISYTGFTTQVVDVLEGQDVYDIVLSQDGIGLDEVLVIGYSPVKRKDLVGSVSSISTEDIDVQAGSTVQSALRNAAGVTVQQSSGAPGAAFNIRVRGSTSITASNEPLFVVDGVPVISGNFARTDIGGQSANALADINPADIESMEILKDASTTAIYGSRAANGVVLITTKSGKAGKTRFNINQSYGFNEPIKLIDVVDNVGYTDYIEERYGTRNISALDPGLDTSVYNNWQDLIYNRNPILNTDVSMSGGTGNTSFYASLSYDDNQGALEGTRFRRYSARLNLKNTASDRLTTSINIGYTNSNNKLVQNDNNIYGATSSSILLPPTVPIRNDDGSYGSAFGLENPIAATEAYENRLISNRLIGNVAATYYFIDELSFTAKLGADVLSLRENVFEPSALQSSANGIISEGSTTDTRLINEYTLNYNNSFGNTQFTAVAGAIFQRDDVRRNYFSTNNLPSDNFPSADAAASPSDVLGDVSGDVLHSYIGNVNFNFGSSLYVTASVRADGSSRFINDRWGVFPGIAAGYNFANNGNVGVFELLKLRASYGLTGNNNIGNFNTRQLYGAGRSYLNSPGIAPSQIGNPDLVWETTGQFDVGLDLGLLESRIGATFDFYIKNTTDLILDRPIPTTTGFLTVPSNIGDMRNVGFEASLTFLNVQKPDFDWTTTLFGAVNRNEVLSLYQDQPQDFGFATRLAVGEPIGSFFGYETDGIFQNADEIEAANNINPGDDNRDFQPNVAPGDIRFVDQNGDGTINDDDRVFIGNALPDFTGGIDNKFNYKGIGLAFFFQFNLGNEVFNNNLAFAEGLNSVFAPTVRAYENAWREEGDGNTFPRITGEPGAGNNRSDSDRFVEDGSFVRLKTATLSYNLPSTVLEPINFRSLRVFVRGTNLITWTDYSWFDPEVNSFGDSNVALGTDFLTSPVSRTVEFGINIGL
ncbi:SusC/RagA family TonB-linked outer membrane protein [Lewinella sp. IMCC34191]|uniref:SusC/RagA family TonB-linked outer membrane protein n=1 Tax=Lewinella sp. IMCC34191 TaxID=2259172 RepID=UPI000E254B6C|nr:TonB-dependent receptor [Lewinella sp. IMCC34191]